MQSLQQKLLKCAAAIRAHTARGGTLQSVRGQSLAIRYDSLRLEAIEKGVWLEFCQQQDWAPGHTAFDVFA